MLNNDEHKKFLRAANSSNSYNSSNSLSNFDLRFINNVEQLDEILSRFQRQPVSFYINRGLVKLGNQAVLLLYSKGGPYESLSQYVEAAIYNLVKQVLMRGCVSNKEEKEHASNEENKEPEKPTKPAMKCFLCGKPAKKTAIYRPNGKQYYVCLEHSQKLAEIPDKWMIIENSFGGGW